MLRDVGADQPAENIRGQTVFSRSDNDEVSIHRDRDAEMSAPDIWGVQNVSGYTIHKLGPDDAKWKKSCTMNTRML